MQAWRLGCQDLAYGVLIIQEAASAQLLLQHQPLVPGEVVLAPGADREQRLEDVGRGSHLEMKGLLYKTYSLDKIAV